MDQLNNEFTSKLIISLMMSQQQWVDFYYCDFPPKTLRTKSYIVKKLQKLFQGQHVDLKDLQELVSYHHDKIMDDLRYQDSYSRIVYESGKNPNILRLNQDLFLESLEVVDTDTLPIYLGD